MDRGDTHQSKKAVKHKDKQKNTKKHNVNKNRSTFMVGTILKVPFGGCGATLESPAPRAGGWWQK
jgi:hypothetical protein